MWLMATVLDNTNRRFPSLQDVLLNSPHLGSHKSPLKFKDKGPRLHRLLKAVSRLQCKKSMWKGRYCCGHFREIKSAMSANSNHKNNVKWILQFNVGRCYDPTVLLPCIYELGMLQVYRKDKNRNDRNLTFCNSPKLEAIQMPISR